MRSGVPWSVKGIEPEAREAAKQAAQRAGVTLGAWLNQIIMEAGTDEVGRPTSEQRPMAPQPSFAPSSTPQAPQIDMTPVAEAMRHIVQRVESSERRTSDLARQLEQTVGHLASRLDQSERAMEQSSEQRTLDPLERKIQHLAERLEEAERGRTGRRPDDKAIQTLEKAVGAVVDHLDTAERRTEASLAEIRETLAGLSSRINEREEEEEREEAQARARAIDTHLQTLATRLEKMEHSVTGVGSQAVEAALKAINEKSDAEQHKATIAGLQRNLNEITQRLERAESRTDDTLKAFERTVASIAKRLEDLDRPRPEVVPEAVHAIEARIEQMADRLHQTEDMTVQATQAIERAIAGMSDSLHVSENRSREMIESLHVMLERMTDRLGRLEKEAKAALSKPMLAPQIGVAPTAGNGFVPGAQAFPVPNFDAAAPAFGNGFGMPPAEFKSPFAEPALPAEHGLPIPPTAAPAAPEPTKPLSDVPPPFAMEADRLEPSFGAEAPAEADEETEAEISNPAVDSARAAHDFLAAARRAAQAAAQAGRNGPPPNLGPAAFGEGAGRFTAIESESEARRKKLILGSFVAILLVAAGFAAMRLMNGQPVIPQPVIQNAGPAEAPATATGTEAKPAAPAAATAPAATEPAQGKPADMGASTTTNPTASHPEANPGDAGANSPASKAAAAQGEGAPASTTAPKAESPIVPMPRKPIGPQTTIPRSETNGPTLTPAPAKPVTSEPLDNAPKAPTASGEAPRDAASQYELGQRYANGDGVALDLTQAARWYGQAADQGLAIAQYRLATLYEKGRGVPQDDAKARTLYEKAAVQGNVKAMHNLAVIYAEGRGTRQDFTTAARWFGEAADYGLGDSQYNLAILLERGLGVKQDLGSAYKWLAIAAKGGDTGAAQKRDELAAKLDAATLAQAKVAAETWAPKRPDPAANGDIGSFKSGAAATSETTGSIAPNVGDIAKAQAMLIELGYDPGSSDGLMGPRTRDAILAYQRSAGLDQTGSVNPALLKSLELATR
jgi:localization factor PodJL